MTETQNPLVVIVERQQIQNPQAQVLVDTFKPLYEEAMSTLAGSDQIVVTSEDQTDEMKRARERRLLLKDVRVRVEKARKTAKDGALRYGRAVDDIAGIITDKIVPEEARLDAAEKFAERLEQERRARRRAERAALLAPFNVDVTHIVLEDMPDEVFERLLQSSRRDHEAREAESRRMEAEQREQERLKQEETERLRQEADALRKENDRIRREAAQVVAAPPVQRAAGDSDKAQLLRIAADVRSIYVPPGMRTEAGSTAANSVRECLEITAKEIEAIAKSLD